MLAGVVETLGGAVAANPSCLGVLSAAEIDPEGNINTTRLPNGRWVTGSGGANDMASSSDCVVLAVATPRRYVPRLTHRTSPGHRVRDVVSHFGRFSRPGANERFELASWLPPQGGAHASREEPPEEPVSALRRLTAWPLDEGEDAGADPARPVGISPSLAPEKPVTTEELALLRQMDPEGFYR